MPIPMDRRGRRHRSRTPPRRGAFAEESYGLDDIEAEVDADLASYGFQSKGRLGDGVDPEALAEMAEAVDIGALLPAATQGGMFEAVVEVGGTDGAFEIAARIMNKPEFKHWAELRPKQKAGLVEAAISASAIPGVDLSSGGAVREAYDSGEGFWGTLGSMGSAAWETMPGDASAILRGFAAEVTPFETTDAVVNELAMSYVVAMKMGYPVDEWIAKKIDEEQPAAIAPTQSFVLPGGAGDAPAPSAPTVVIPSARVGGWTPTKVLAIGYGLTAGLAALGVK